jgi:hypothetical protein
VTRYDSTLPFDSASAWHVFDTAKVNPKAKGFKGAVFDGRYLYLVPHHNGARHGIVTRLDTRADFGTAASWQTFDASSVDPRAKGFVGGVFDGKSVYFVPWDDDAGHNGVVLRFDGTNFASASSWSVFDVATVNAGAKAFHGGVFDGRYVYLVPYADGGGSVVVRHDVRGEFSSGSSWQAFDTTSVSPAAKGFKGGAFDGRYVYLSPGGASSLLARFDTTRAFSSPTSWQTFPLTAVNPNASGFAGTAFDGRYLYLVPYSREADIVGRFDARTPPVPESAGGRTFSFF